MIPRFGDPSLEVFSSSAISVNDEAGRVARSRRPGSQEDREGHGPQPRQRKQRSYYVAVKPQGNSRYQEREYTAARG